MKNVVSSVVPGYRLLLKAVHTKLSAHVLWLHCSQPVAIIMPVAVAAVDPAAVAAAADLVLALGPCSMLALYGGHLGWWFPFGGK